MRTWSALTLGWILLAGVGAPARCEDAAGSGLTYVESSSGLGSPQWEAGLTELELADLDGDGHLDIVSIGDHGNPLIQSGEEGLMVWFGNGAGTWSAARSGHFGYGGMAVGDVNGDGLNDVAYGMHHDYSSTDFGDQLIEVALGDGTGRAWTPWDDGLATAGEDYGMFGEDLADVDLDGDLDLASLSFGSGNGFHVYLNQRDGTWRHRFARTGDNCTTNEISFGDVNADGAPDLAVGYQNGTVWLNDGTGGFTLVDGDLPPGGLLGRRGPDLADVNRDGLDDLSVVNSSGGVDVWLWAGTSSWTRASSGLPASGSFETTQMADMNGDGSMDLVGCGNGNVTVWTGNGSGAWSLASTFAIGNPGGCSAFRVGGDADHNGRPDIVLVEDEWISAFDTRNKLRFFKESTVPSSLTARAVYPLGGETFAQGSVRFVEWAAGVPPGQTARVTIEVSTGGASGPWMPVAADLPNNGCYQWSVPAHLESTNCLLRTTVSTPAAGSVVATTPAPFTIAAVDSDGDGVVNWADCAPGDAGSFAAPGEVAGVTVERDPVDPFQRVVVAWVSQSGSAGPATRYDVITGPSVDLGPDGGLEASTCAADDVAGSSFSIPLAVGTGTAHYVLVRGVNVCGTGSYGRTTAGAQRTSTACPP